MAYYARAFRALCAFSIRFVAMWIFRQFQNFQKRKRKLLRLFWRNGEFFFLSTGQWTRLFILRCCYNVSVSVGECISLMLYVTNFLVSIVCHCYCCCSNTPILNCQKKMFSFSISKIRINFFFSFIWCFILFHYSSHCHGIPSVCLMFHSSNQLPNTVIYYGINEAMKYPNLNWPNRLVVHLVTKISSSHKRSDARALDFMLYACCPNHLVIGEYITNSLLFFASVIMCNGQTECKMLRAKISHNETTFWFIFKHCTNFFHWFFVEVFHF